MGRKCESCGYQMPFGRRRTKHPQTGQLVCDGCLPGRRGAPGRPIGYHGSKETNVTKTAAGANWEVLTSPPGAEDWNVVGGSNYEDEALTLADEFVSDGNVDVRVTKDGYEQMRSTATKTAAEDYVVHSRTGDQDEEEVWRGPNLDEAIAEALAEGSDEDQRVTITQGTRMIWANGYRVGSVVQGPPSASRTAAFGDTQCLPCAKMDHERCTGCICAEVGHDEAALLKRNRRETSEWVRERVREMEGRQSSRRVAHDSGDGETIYHCPFCFSGDVRYLTREGVRSFADTAGTSQWVLTADTDQRTSGRWVQAEIREFGEQPLMKVTLRRNKRTRVIEATPEHRWLVKSDRRVPGAQARSTDRDVLTRDLRPGQRLSYLRAPGLPAEVSLDTSGIRHGVVFGDGSAQGKTASVSLWGEKDKQLLQFFPDRRYKDVNTSTRVLGTGVPGVHVTGDLWAWMKALPDTEDQDYLYGWLAGYFAADGTVSKQGQIIINSANLAHLEAVQDIALSLGITTYGITSKMRIGFPGREPSALYGLEFVGSTLREDFFLIEAQRDRFRFRDYGFERIGWTVVSVEATSKVETVYCAVVPGTHTFALEGNIWVGNCGAGQVTARSDGTTECGFCQNVFTVQVQPKHPSMPQTIDGVPVNDPSMPGDGTHEDTPPATTEGPKQEGILPEKQPPAKQQGLVPEVAATVAAPPVVAFRTASGAMLPEDAYVRHLAIAFADDKDAVIDQVRASRRKTD